MDTLASQRCFNHHEREAVARCPQCSRFFCRECVTEHDDIMLCASCIKAIVKPSLTKRLYFSGIFRAGQFIVGFFIAWIFFYYLGEILIGIPSSFHEGSVWQADWWLNGK